MYPSSQRYVSQVFKVLILTYSKLLAKLLGKYFSQSVSTGAANAWF
jgi:hypothetical protein